MDNISSNGTASKIIPPSQYAAYGFSSIHEEKSSMNLLSKANNSSQSKSLPENRTIILPSRTVLNSNTESLLKKSFAGGSSQNVTAGSILSRKLLGEPVQSVLNEHDRHQKSQSGDFSLGKLSPKVGSGNASFDKTSNKSSPVVMTLQKPFIVQRTPNQQSFSVVKARQEFPSRSGLDRRLSELDKAKKTLVQSPVINNHVERIVVGSSRKSDVDAGFVTKSATILKSNADRVSSFGGSVVNSAPKRTLKELPATEPSGFVDGSLKTLLNEAKYVQVPTSNNNRLTEFKTQHCDSSVLTTENRLNFSDSPFTAKMSNSSMKTKIIHKQNLFNNSPKTGVKTHFSKIAVSKSSSSSPLSKPSNVKLKTQMSWDVDLLGTGGYSEYDDEQPITLPKHYDNIQDSVFPKSPSKGRLKVKVKSSPSLKLGGQKSQKRKPLTIKKSPFRGESLREKVLRMSGSQLSPTKKSPTYRDSAPSRNTSRSFDNENTAQASIHKGIKVMRKPENTTEVADWKSERFNSFFLKKANSKIKCNKEAELQKNETNMKTGKSDKHEETRAKSLALPDIYQDWEVIVNSMNSPVKNENDEVKVNSVKQSEKVLMNGTESTGKSKLKVLVKMPEKTSRLKTASLKDTEDNSDYSDDGNGKTTLSNLEELQSEMINKIMDDVNQGSGKKPKWIISPMAKRWKHKAKSERKTMNSYWRKKINEIKKERLLKKKKKVDMNLKKVRKVVMDDETKKHIQSAIDNVVAESLAETESKERMAEKAANEKEAIEKKLLEEKLAAEQKAQQEAADAEKLKKEAEAMKISLQRDIFEMFSNEMSTINDCAQSRVISNEADDNCVTDASILADLLTTSGAPSRNTSGIIVKQLDVQKNSAYKQLIAFPKRNLIVNISTANKVGEYVFVPLKHYVRSFTPNDSSELETINSVPEKKDNEIVPKTVLTSRIQRYKEQLEMRVSSSQFHVTSMSTISLYQYQYAMVPIVTNDSVDNFEKVVKQNHGKIMSEKFMLTPNVEVKEEASSDGNCQVSEKTNLSAQSSPDRQTKPIFSSPEVAKERQSNIDSKEISSQLKELTTDIEKESSELEKKNLKQTNVGHNFIRNSPLIVENNQFSISNEKGVSNNVEEMEIMKKNMITLQRVVETQLKIGGMNCSYCNLFFDKNRKIDFDEHESKCKEFKFSCNSCKGKFLNLSDQVYHEIKAHMFLIVNHPSCKSVSSTISNPCPTLRMSFKCTACPMYLLRAIVYDFSAFISHYISHLDKDGIITERYEDKIICVKCNRIFSVNAGEQCLIHEYLCSTLKIVCKTCGWKFAFEEDLQRHEIEHMKVDSAGYQCSICGVKFMRSDGMLSHYRYHFKEKNVHCTECDKKFLTTGMLAMHKKWKHSQGPCRFCNKEFSSATARQAHEEHLHLKHFQHSCPKCGFRVKSATQLRVHNRLHTGDKPYVCGDCDEKFLSRILLKKHRNYKCSKRNMKTIKEEGESDSSDNENDDKEKVNDDVDTGSTKNSNDRSTAEEVIENKSFSSSSQPSKKSIQQNGKLDSPAPSVMRSFVEGTMSVEDIFKRYQDDFETDLPKLSLSELDTSSDEDEKQDVIETAAKEAMLNEKDKNTNSVWSCPLCLMLFPKLWGVKAHITLKHPGRGVYPVLHDDSDESVMSKRAFVKKIKMKIKEEKKLLKLQAKAEKVSKVVTKPDDTEKSRPKEEVIDPALITCPLCPGYNEHTTTSSSNSVSVTSLEIKNGEMNKIEENSKEERSENEKIDSTEVKKYEGPSCLRKVFVCNLCKERNNSYESLVTHHYGTHTDVALPDYEVVKEKVVKNKSISNVQLKNKPISNVQHKNKPISNVQHKNKPISNVQHKNKPISNVHHKNKPISNVQRQAKVIETKSLVVPVVKKVKFESVEERLTLLPDQQGNIVKGRGRPKRRMSEDNEELQNRKKKRGRPKTKLSFIYNRTDDANEYKKMYSNKSRRYGDGGMYTEEVYCEQDDKLYCYCRTPYNALSEMIGCDREDCELEWFHFECVGIVVAPKGKWYCPDCVKLVNVSDDDKDDN